MGRGSPGLLAAGLAGVWARGDGGQWRPAGTETWRRVWRPVPEVRGVGVPRADLAISEEDADSVTEIDKDPQHPINDGVERGYGNGWSRQPRTWTAQGRYAGGAGRNAYGGYPPAADPPAMPPLCCGWLPVMRQRVNYLVTKYTVDDQFFTRMVHNQAVAEESWRRRFFCACTARVRATGRMQSLRRGVYRIARTWR